MATNIEWTMSDDGTPGKTWNPTRGCSRISPGCLHCYAERQAARFAGLGTGVKGVDIQGGIPPFAGFVQIANGHPQWTGKVELVESKLMEPLHWHKPCRCFVNSMSDLFHESLSPILIDRVFAVMALCPHITFQVLTKRADVMQAYVNSDALVRVNRQIELWLEQMKGFPKGRSFPHYCEQWPLRNVWLGVSVENQKYADERIPLLLQTPAAVRFVSYEPALGPVDFNHIRVGNTQYTGTALGAKGHPGPPIFGFQKLDWIIAGFESGPGARPAEEDWMRSAKDQCVMAGTAFFYKQSAIKGKKIPTPELDGQKWMQFPEVRP